MSHPEHLLTIVEPSPGGDTTLDLARDTVARGGTATVLMVITDRVKRDIRNFAESEGLAIGEAEAIALEQLQTQCQDRIGDVPWLVTKYGAISSDVVQYVTADTTAVAIPARLVTDKLVERIATYSGRPVIVAPYRVPAAA
ncbi:MAG: hypothetical protein HKN24_11620 [Acidimicrobiales bacterium]|nr:hypothetical protein [Acidimicrobiales bacterium]